jgi:hypothetical protein
VTSPYVAHHGVASSYEHLCVFGCSCYTNLSTKSVHKLASSFTKYIFLEYSADHKGYRCLDLTTSNIIISWHIIFYEADFPFSTLPYVTNDLDIFLNDDSPGATPMTVALPVHRIPSGLLAAAGGQTACPSDQTTPGTEANCSIVRPGGQTAPGINAGSPTAPPPRRSGRPWNRGWRSDRRPRRSDRLARRSNFVTCFADFSRAPHDTHDFGCAPRGAHASDHAMRGPPSMTPNALPAARRPSSTRSTTRVTLRLRRSHRHHLYISGHWQRRPYQWHLRLTLIRWSHERSGASCYRPKDSPCRSLQRRPCRWCPSPSTMSSSIWIGAAPWKMNLLPSSPTTIGILSLAPLAPASSPANGFLSTCSTPMSLWNGTRLAESFEASPSDPTSTIMKPSVWWSSRPRSAWCSPWSSSAPSP